MAVGYVWALCVSFERFETLTYRVKIPLRPTRTETYDVCAEQGGCFLSDVLCGV
jgi:hypothetical protein